jgi:hypothetical protein
LLYTTIATATDPALLTACIISKGSFPMMDGMNEYKPLEKILILTTSHTCTLSSPSSVTYSVGDTYQILNICHPNNYHIHKEDSFLLQSHFVQELQKKNTTTTKKNKMKLLLTALQNTHL